MFESDTKTGCIIVFRTEHTSATELLNLQHVLEFFGLRAWIVDAMSSTEVDRALTKLEDQSVLATLIAHDALKAIDRARYCSAISSRVGTTFATMIFGISPDCDSESVRDWSGGAIVSCEAATEHEAPATLKFGDVGTITGVLSGRELPCVAKPVCRLGLRADGPDTVLSAVRSGVLEPVFVHSSCDAGELFLSAGMQLCDSSWVGRPDSMAKAFSLLAPYVLFIKHIAGEYGWHLNRQYANFTIDDPWLTEPYGHISYPSLLDEMERHNFHTTIAFVPWNYDRSESQTAELFRVHSDRFSICMHGNDHLHREFGEYDDNPVERQIANIKQGIGRMFHFTALTGISADHFMVFPHGTAPEPTLAALRTYNFIGTANSLNVPLGTPFPTSATFLLRPFTPDYAGLLSFYRYSAEAPVPWNEIAIHSFLGNPVLFYGHQQMFASGIGAFNPVADQVNALRPDTVWGNLGEVARQTYLVRRRIDGVFEVRMLGSEIVLRNTTSDAAAFHIVRDDLFSGVNVITIDDVDTSTSSDGILRIEVPAGERRNVKVSFANDLNLATQDISKKNLHAAVLRRLSDVRDLYLTKSRVGRLLAEKYYRHGWDSVQIMAEKMSVAIMSTIAALAKAPVNGLKRNRG